MAAKRFGDYPKVVVEGQGGRAGVGWGWEEGLLSAVGVCGRLGPMSVMVLPLSWANFMRRTALCADHAER